jgi:hypothetical protein
MGMVGRCDVAVAGGAAGAPEHALWRGRPAVVVGGPPAGGLGTYLLPTYWRNIGVVFPPQSAVTLINHVIYFGGNDITTPLIVLSLYVLAGWPSSAT